MKLTVALVAFLACGVDAVQHARERKRLNEKRLRESRAQQRALKGSSTEKRAKKSSTGGTPGHQTPSEAKFLPDEGKVTYQPGCMDWGYYVRDYDGNRVRLSNGLWGRPIAFVEEKVDFIDGSVSSIEYHKAPDGGAVFAKEDGTGFYYVSNNEDGDYEDNELDGGVYVLEMDNNHNVVDYYPILEGTVDNCAGGSTPWGTWVSCEEEDYYGKCWQTDPANKDQTGPTKSEATSITGYLGNWEGFAWDDGDYPPRGYVTDDAEPEDWPGAYGALNRFTPDAAAMECYHKETKAERWCTLNSGTIDYLKFLPSAGGSNCGDITWVSDPTESSAGMMRKAEGIDVTDRILRFVAKEDRQYFEIDLEKQTYCQYSTLEGFAQEPDNIRYLGDILYVCTDGRTPNGVYGINKDLQIFPVMMEIDYVTEAAGVAFSPDGKVMYVSFQDTSTWQFWRMDGRSFADKVDKTCYKSDPGAHNDIEQVLEPLVVGFAEEVFEDMMDL